MLTPLSLERDFRSECLRAIVGDPVDGKDILSTLIGSNLPSRSLPIGQGKRRGLSNVCRDSSNVVDKQHFKIQMLSYVMTSWQ